MPLPEADRWFGSELCGCEAGFKSLRRSLVDLKPVSIHQFHLLCRVVVRIGRGRPMYTTLSSSEARRHTNTG